MKSMMSWLIPLAPFTLLWGMVVDLLTADRVKTHRLPREISFRSSERTAISHQEAPVLADHPVFPILLATDLEASRTFYRDTLGLELIREDEGDRLVFRCGAGTQIAVTKSTVGTSDTQTQMAWRVPDIHAALEDLRA